MFDMITDELELFYQSDAMTNNSPTLTMTLRCVIASCIVCSLLMFPSFASAQGGLGTLDQGSGLKVEPVGEPDPSQDPTSQAPATVGSTSKEPTTVITPGAPPATPVVDGATVEQGAVAENTEAVGGDGTTEKQLTLEEREAIWMAELEALTFKEIVKRIRDDERKIDQLYISMPVNAIRQQLEIEKDIKSLQDEVVELNRLLEPAAVEAFRSNPMESRAATVKVFEVLASKLAPRGRNSSYDPAGGLRLVNTILEIKGGDVGKEPGTTPTPEDEPLIRIIFQGYLASYGLQDWKSADDFLTRLENLEIGLDPKLRENFEATLEAWKIEEALRAEEAKADDLPRVKLETTDGDVVIELFENEAPNTVANFIKLVKDGYYDNLEFFHVTPSNYARSGCTANDGTTNPGYRIRNEFENGRRHFAGTVVMQNDGENTAGSQFIILHRPDPNLLGKVAAFGRVIEGLDIVYGFKTVNRIRNLGGEATVINKATVLRDRGHEYEPVIIEDAASLLRQQANEVLPGKPAKKKPAYRGRPRAGRPLAPPTTRPLAPAAPPTSGSSTTGSSSRLLP